jgi:hypothetical protein
MKAIPPNRLFRTGILLLLLVAWTTPADAAFPRLLMIYGKPLSKPIVVENPLDVVKIFEGSSDGTTEQSLAGRPYFEVALFWGEQWNRYMDEGKPASALKPEDVTPFGNIPNRGRFYPACANAAAQISLFEPQSQRTHGIWKVPEEGLKVLESLGVPTKGNCKTPQ